MAESATRTDKRFQLTVLGILALAATVMMGAMSIILETDTIRNAGLLLLAFILITIAYLAVDL